MARRPSTVSMSSLASSTLSPKPAHSVASPETTSNGARSTVWLPPRSVSLSSKLDTIVAQNGFSNVLEPDELFIKYTVSEVKAVQRRLRTDADAKQEELRLMVGERYRDLLQASTSIISIAQSSNHVLEALEEMRNVVGSTDLPRTPKRSVVGQEDKHLHALQSLSAHMKLLLDAPEHLWRLMERRMYLHAAWLFLLSRVVHRVLTRDDEGDEDGWQTYGIEVSEQMPLVQRQWDTVSQFRSQIIHKATISLREYACSSGEICATLLTLHLLESRPLPETLSIFLAQRSKALSILLSRTQERVANGHASEPSVRRNKTTNRVRRALAVLDVVSRTMGTARVIFSDQAASDNVCTMRRALQYIQTAQESTASSLPAELRLTTQTLLTSLPSSTHFLLLPLSIRSYKPYVDSASLTSSIPQPQLDKKLDGWFRKASEDVRRTMEKWFSSLENIREVWDVRMAICAWLGAVDGLETHEKAHIKSVVDDVAQRQVHVVWKSALALAEATFREHLAVAVNAFKEDSESVLLVYARPVEYLFQAPPTPSMFQASLNSSLAVVSFQKYKSALQRQVAGRTPLLDDVLNSAERHAQDLQEDLEAMQGDDDDSRTLIARLVASYRPNAESLATEVANALRTTASDIVDDSESSMRSLIFIGRIADELSTSSQFVTRLGCDPSATHDFQSNMAALHSLTIERWREHVIRHIMQGSCCAGAESMPTRPSARLMQALLSLSSSIQQLGIAVSSLRQRHLVGGTLQRFVSQILERLADAEVPLPQQDWQELCDLDFLRVIAGMWDSECEDVARRLDGRIAQKWEKLRAQGTGTTSQQNLESALQDHLSRTQTLLAPLLPLPTSPTTSTRKTKTEKSTSLLHHGLPMVEQQFQPAVELVKPSPRFGLLLVGSTAVR
ncbi:hypothetical protein B0H21DRAFT_780985 [Amylocystis lapponica]|nr:hypothetical protein B0H21DRAFT_780985 [Amylocystis lapponica]